MPKKPTEPFGYIAFGKDGSVEKHIESLPDTKSSQEHEIGQRFTRGLETLIGESLEVQALPENDHDFMLIRKNQSRILAQATEIVSHDYLHAISPDDFKNGNHSFSSSVIRGSKEIFGVDDVAKEAVLLSRIKSKIGKHYSKPTFPLWLLVWTVCDDYQPFWHEGGQFRVSCGVTKALEHLSRHGAGPFDEIWFFKPNLRPYRIWPPSK